MQCHVYRQTKKTGRCWGLVCTQIAQGGAREPWVSELLLCCMTLCTAFCRCGRWKVASAHGAAQSGLQTNLIGGPVNLCVRTQCSASTNPRQRKPEAVTALWSLSEYLHNGSCR